MRPPSVHILRSIPVQYALAPCSKALLHPQKFCADFFKLLYLQPVRLLFVHISRSLFVMWRLPVRKPCSILRYLLQILLISFNSPALTETFRNFLSLGNSQTKDLYSQVSFSGSVIRFLSIRFNYRLHQIGFVQRVLIKSLLLLSLN